MRETDEVIEKEIASYVFPFSHSFHREGSNGAAHGLVYLLLTLVKMGRLGFDYHSIGRANVKPQ